MRHLSVFGQEFLSPVRFRALCDGLQIDGYPPSADFQSPCRIDVGLDHAGDELQPYRRVLNDVDRTRVYHVRLTLDGPVLARKFVFIVRFRRLKLNV